MNQFAGIFFDVDSGDADGLGTCCSFDIQVTVLAEGQVILGNLIGLRQVGIEVVLPILLGEGSDLAVGGKAGLDGIVHHLLVQHRQSARHTHAHRASLGVWFCPEGGGTATENFGGGFQFTVNLQADDHFITF